MSDIIHQKCIALVAQLKQLRKEKGITGTQLAKITGIPHQNIYRIESGKFFPSLENAMKIATALGKELKID